MSLLRRYRQQPDGFEQLLMLVESSTPKKQNHFFKLISQEDASWSALIKLKMLSIDRIFEWPDAYLMEVLHDFPARFLATALKGHEKNYVSKACELLPSKKQEEFIYEVENRTYSETERHAAQSSLIKKVRVLAKTGRLRLEKIDPQLSPRNEAA